MASFVIFRESRRLNLRADDLSVAKLSMIFQVRPHSIYLTDDRNQGILPGPEGAFALGDLQDGGHYEVHGESTAEEGSSWQGQNPAARFAFRRPSSSALPVASGAMPVPAPRAVGPKLNTRNVLIADLVNGRPETKCTVAVRFTEFEASVSSIRDKVVEALGEDEPMVIVDSHGNEILDCEGTRGSAFWKQHARKVFAVPQAHMLRPRGGKRRRESQHEDTDLPLVVDQIEEVILASQGLKDISDTLKDLANFAQANHRTTLSLSDSQTAAVKAAFSCIICRDPMKKPMFASCCRSILGCSSCMEQWQESHSYCPKCRGPFIGENMQAVVGLDEALAALENIIS